MISGSPCGPRILIKIKSELNETLEKTESSIYIPDSAKRSETYNATRGTVLSIGPDAYNDVFQKAVGAIKPWCEVGDEVLFKSHASIFPDNLDEGLVLVNDQDVLWNFSKESK